MTRTARLSYVSALTLITDAAEEGLDLMKDDDQNGVQCEIWGRRAVSIVINTLGQNDPDVLVLEDMVAPLLVDTGSRFDKRRREVRIGALCKAVSHLGHIKELLVNLEEETDMDHKKQQFVFIGHGRSPAWKDLRDFLKERLHLPVDEINRLPIAGATTVDRLQEMLDSACFAFLVMTAEDEDSEGKARARQNVVHEVGLFQGKLGFKRAIVLLEHGCEEFSNITGLSQIRFDKGNIGAKFEDIRRVLEREGLISGTGAAF